jgi:hypothetical protein
MAQVDVSAAMLDPDFVQSVTILRRSPTVDQYGQNQLLDKIIPTIGSVQPATGKALMRLPEAFRVADVKSFWLKDTIVADSRCQYPDVLVADGQRYAVQLVFDWSDWGQGWTEGTCVREKPSL